MSSSPQPKSLASIKNMDDTVRGVAPTKSVGETAPLPRVSFASDLAALFKLRVTLMVVLTAWAGYFLAARHAGIATLSPRLLFTMLGIGLVSAGAAGFNEWMEVPLDGRMHRTRRRPLPAGRLLRLHAALLSALVTLLGAALLAYFANIFTAVLALLTSASYLFAYTPLKPRSPISTFIGAIPGAMPPLLGWAAVRDMVEWQALALFAIVFFWQFPHFLAIAWLYREDYERAGILMQPVVDPSGRGTILQILLTGTALIPVTLLPAVLHMSGAVYIVGALLLGLGYLAFGVRLAWQRLPATSAHSKRFARHLLQASIIYLPLLFGLMMLDGTR